MDRSIFHLNGYDLAFLALIPVGFTFVLLVWHGEKTTRTANRWLAAALAVVMCWILGILAADMGLGAHVRGWNWLPLRGMLALGPLLFFYVRKKTVPQSPFRRIDLLHFVPLLVELSAHWWEAARGAAVGRGTGEQLRFQLLTQPLPLLAAISVLGYIYWSLRLIEAYYERQTFTEGACFRSEWQWLRRLLEGFGWIWIVGTLYAAVAYYYHTPPGAADYPVNLLIAIISIRIAVIIYLKPPAILRGPEPVLPKPTRSMQMKQKAGWLKQVMEVHMFYQDPTLSVASMAKALDLPPHELSRLINMALGKNFNDFVNEYRIREVIRRMKDPANDRLTLLGIAYDCGFNSKTTFNRAFKQITGKSPLDYKHDLKTERPPDPPEPRPAPAPTPAMSGALVGWSRATGRWHGMFRSHLHMAIRNLQKNKAFSLINIFGLSVGMAAGLIILQYVRFELSYDDFHHNKDRIFRVTQDRIERGQLSTRWAAGCYEEGSAFKANFPEVADVVKVVGHRPVLAIHGDRQLVLDKPYYASPSFFTVFSYPLVSGDPQTVLRDVFSAVISETAAKELFGTTEARGKVFRMDTSLVTITGVMKDFPENTHFKSDLLLSYPTFLRSFAGTKNIDHSWRDDGCLTYLLLQPGTDPVGLEATIKHYVDSVYQKLRWSGSTAVYHLLPLQRIHLSPNLLGEAEQHADRKSVYLLGGIALFVILIAWINYVNLATARGISRAREVGVRKTLGSVRSQLIGQFMMESLLLNGLAMLLSIGLIYLFLPVFSALSGRALTPGLLFTPGFWLGLAALFLVGSFFSGFYPALVLSRYRPVQVLKGKLALPSGGVVLRKGMVAFQFAASIFLLIGSVTVYEQVRFMEHQQLGITIDQTLVIRPPLEHVDSFYQTMSAFKAECLRDPGVKSMTVSTSIPGEPANWNAGDIRLQGAAPAEGKEYRIIGGDYDYLAAYGARPVAGRVFSPSFSTDPQAVVLNEKASQAMGFARPAEAIGRQIDYWGNTYTIIGVVENYHQQSLHDDYDAIIFRCIPGVRGKISVRVSTASLDRTLSVLRTSWKRFFPADPFDHFFLDRYFNDQYLADNRFAQVFASVTGIGILVACLGLFGLVSYMTVQRTKEIGIRKVLGASVGTILGLLYKDLAMLVLVAFGVAAPIGWLAIHRWLETYAFRTSVSWLFFAIPLVIVAVVAVATVSYVSVKAALASPVRSLQTE